MPERSKKAHSFPRDFLSSLNTIVNVVFDNFSRCLELFEYIIYNINCSLKRYESEALRMRHSTDFKQ